MNFSRPSLPVDKTALPEERLEQLHKANAGSPQNYPVTEESAWSPFAKNVSIYNQYDEALVANSYVTSGNTRVTTRFFRGPYFDKQYPEGCRLWSLPGKKTTFGNNTMNSDQVAHFALKSEQKAKKELQEELAAAKKAGKNTTDLEWTLEHFYGTEKDGGQTYRKENTADTNKDWESGLRGLVSTGVISHADYMKLCVNPTQILKGKTPEELEAFVAELRTEGVPEFHQEFVDFLGGTEQLHQNGVEDYQEHPDFDYNTFVENRKKITQAKEILQNKFGLDTVNSPIDVYDVLTKDWMNPDKENSIWGQVSKELNLNTDQRLTYTLPRQMFELMAPGMDNGMQPGDWMDEEYELDGFNRYDLAMTGYMGDANPYTRGQFQFARNAIAGKDAIEPVKAFLKHIPKMNSQMAGASLAVGSVLTVLIGTFLIHASTIRSRDHYWTLYKFDQLVASLPDAGYFPTEAQIHQDVRFKTWVSLPFYQQDEDDEF